MKPLSLVALLIGALVGGALFATSNNAPEPTQPQQQSMNPKSITDRLVPDAVADRLTPANRLTPDESAGSSVEMPRRAPHGRMWLLSS
jgi:hypothetical protein